MLSKLFLTVNYINQQAKFKINRTILTFLNQQWNYKYWHTTTDVNTLTVKMLLTILIISGNPSFYLLAFKFLSLDFCHFWVNDDLKWIASLKTDFLPHFLRWMTKTFFNTHLLTLIIFNHSKLFFNIFLQDKVFLASMTASIKVKLNNSYNN